MPAMVDQLTWTLRCGIKGWDNFKDAKGNAIEYKSANGMMDEDLVDAIPINAIKELSFEILNQNKVGKDEVKN